MLLRKLTAAFCPLLLCVALCALLRLLDGWLGSGSFLAFLLKGLLLGAALALTLPAAGIKAHTNGLAPWMFAGAALLAAVLIYQYLETMGLWHSDFLNAVITINGQVVLVEGGFLAYLTVAALLYRRR